ncbi:hypothetical protein BSL78_29831 [Apostichopus japonicus]|uniref:Uncharacterized protein n=1 Tax=Stichopus japonicus TaxID=307972 RepID=A0A2G8JC78_STIJA|nr:hypothetical protein BSL78_29831 [Apostichopus japonicus]
MGGNGGKGGSVITITSKTVHLDGSVLVDGAGSSSGGAGSGGSVLMRVSESLLGYGSGISNGGTASNSGYGSGSGGRIAVYFEGGYHFMGTLTAGGGGTTSNPGGPGSIYLSKSSEAGIAYERLTVDNDNGQSHLYFTLDEASTDVVLDELDLLNNIPFHLKQDGIDRSLDIKKFVGDGTALMHIHDHHRVIFERDPSVNDTEGKVNINVKVDAGGQALMSPKTHLLGIGANYLALDLSGSLYGIYDLVIGDDRVAYITASAGAITTVDFEEEVTAGMFTFASLVLHSGAKMDFEPDMGAILEVGSIQVKFDSSITADYFDLTVSELDVEIWSELSCSADERSTSEFLDIQLGAGDQSSSGSGGAGHGSPGGIGHLTSVRGGPAYGSCTYRWIEEAAQ